MNLDKKSALRLLAVLCGAILFYSLLDKPEIIIAACSWVFSLLLPLLIGFAIAFVLNLPMRALENKVIFKNTKDARLLKLKRPISLVLSIVFIVAVVWLILGLVLPELINAITTLIGYLPTAFTAVQTFIETHMGDYPQIEQFFGGISINWSDISNQIMGYVTNGATNLLGGTVSIVASITGGVVNGVVAIVFAIYILFNKETLKRQTKSLLHAVLPAKAESTLLYVARITKTTFASFVTGQCIEACILGSLCFIGMSILRLPYAPMIGALVGFMALIPIVGAFMSMFIGAFMILMVEPIDALWFVIFLLILQQIEGNLIYPHVVGSKVGLPGIWVLACITVGAAISGLIGMLFAVPVGSVVYTILREWVRKRNAQKPAAIE